MAKALVEVIGDSASAVRALEQTSAALTATGDAAKGAAVDMDAFAASMARAQATRAETLLAQAGSLRQLAATSVAGSTEQLAANEAAVKRQTQAYRLLGIQAATTGESLTKTAGTVGRGLTTYVTAPAVFIGYEAVKQAMDYQQAILLIRTQAGASQHELDLMNRSVLQLVQSGQSFGQTAHSMAQGLYYVESEGIRGERALATIRAAAAGAAKGQTDMADTTNALTSAMKIWNVQADGAAKTMATIDAITASGKMHLQDLNEAFGTRFFSTAQAIGVPLEQAGALLDVFTKMGVPASSAATNLTTTFIRMVNPAKGAAAALQQLGLTNVQLGRDLQSGGVTKALADLTKGYDSLVKSQGPAAGEAAVFGAFGGSHGGGAALQAIKGYQSYMQSLGEIQRLNNPATFWSQVGQAMDSPAMKVKQDVAEIGADFIKLGTALAPTVTAIAGDISGIATEFDKLPGPIKDSVGVIVGILAVGGPIGAAISGVTKLVDGLKAAFGGIGLSAQEGVVGADPALTGLGTSIDGDITKVRTLRGELLGLASKVFVTALILDIIPKSSLGQSQLDKLGLGFLGHIPVLGGLETQAAKYGYEANQALAGLTGGSDAQIAARRKAGAERRYDATHPGFPTFELWKVGNPHGTRAEYEQQRRLNFDLGHPHSAQAKHDAHTAARHTGPTHHTPPPLYQLPAVPQNIQLDMARAQAGYGSLAKAQEEERKWLLNLIRSGRLKGQALVQAYTDLGSLQTKAVSDAHKSQSRFDQTVHNDQMLAQARIDLADGEYQAAQSLLRKDQARLQLMLSEAKTAEERTAVLRQLAEVEKMRHSKADQFALSPQLQEEIAKANAEAVLNPQGMLSTQVALAKQARADAMKVIHSHTLTMQGLIQAWQIVGQEDQVIAGALGLANSYHAESTAALTKGLGLTHAADMTLRERLAQSEAHRGFAPNSPTTGFGNQHPIHHQRPQHPVGHPSPMLERGGRPMPVHIDVKLVGDIKKIISEVETYTRRNQQRAGGRR